MSFTPSAEIEKSIDAAQRWVEHAFVAGRWRIPVISECMGSTARSLLVTEGRRQERTIQYLLGKKVWEQGVGSTSALVWALLSQGEKNLAIEVAKKCVKAHKLAGRPLSDVDVLDFILKNGVLKSGLSPRQRVIRKMLRGLMSITSSHFWACRSSQLYEFIPHISFMFLEDKRSRDKMIELLVLAQNRDGSYGGNTAPTIKAAFVLRALGEESHFKKAIGWLENVFNENGSLRPIFCQDVYDTAWAVIALSDTDIVDKSVSWLENTMVEGLGYPFFSEGYYPDCDDSSLVLLAKKEAGYLQDDLKTLNFLLQSQNPDGGWGFVSFCSLKHALPYRYLASRTKIIQDALRRRGAALFWHPIFDSTVDMTSRVLITLANAPGNRAEKRKAISKGVCYLMRQYNDGRFHQGARWTDSDVYETSMALIALSLNDAGSEVKGDVLNWLLTHHNLGGDELAHLIWSCLSANAPRETIGPLVGKLVSIQNEDGSWSPAAAFKSTSWYFDPLFSTVLPLLVLRMFVRSH